MIIVALMAELLPSKLLFSLSKNPPTHMANLMVKAQQHMNFEDTLNDRREWDTGPNSQPDKRKMEQQPTPREDKGNRVRVGSNNYGAKPRVNLP